MGDRLAPLETADLSGIRLVATDMDGTITDSGRFSARLFETLDAIARSGRQILVTTGRSAGWVNAIATYLPVAAAIAENGGIYCCGEQIAEPLVAIADLDRHRQQLGAMFARLRDRFPQLHLSTDNAFRLTDWTFDLDDLSASDLDTIRALCVDAGWEFINSSIQCHIRLPSQDKGTGLLQVLERAFPELGVEQVVTVGDSPNDTSMFDARFPYSIGVANIRNYLDRLPHLPAFVTSAEEGAGFRELSDRLAACPLPPSRQEAAPS